MLRAVLLGMARNRAVRAAVVAFPPTRAVVKRFVPGETLDDVLAAARGLADAGLLASIDYLGEDTTNRAQALATTEAYLELLRRLGEEGLAASTEVSVKLSAVGQFLPDGRAVALENAARICEAAQAAGTTVTLDMEDHTTTDSTLGVLAELRERFPDTGAVLQAYLRRTPGDCRALATAGSRVRLCKGAYDEPAEVALRAKRDVDDAFRACLRLLMDGDGYPMVASHDPAMIAEAQAYAARVGRSKDSFEFQMLYGIRSDEQRRLASEGHRMRVYVPFGTDWYGYFMRRLAERPANLAFFGRALVGRR